MQVQTGCLAAVGWHGVEACDCGGHQLVGTEFVSVLPHTLY